MRNDWPTILLGLQYISLIGLQYIRLAMSTGHKMRLRFLKYRTCQRGLVIVSTTTRITILCEFTFEVNFTIVILISDTL